MSYALISLVERKAAKPHVCIWCGEGIAVGETFHDERSSFCGDFQLHRWHPECKKACDTYIRETHECEFEPWDNERPKPEEKTP